MNGKLLLAGVAAIVAMPVAANAQDAATAAANADTSQAPIVVTARKREEQLIDVPLSITALTAEDIQDGGIENVNDLAMQTPGFSMRQAFGRSGGGIGSDGQVRPAIRGMSNILGSPNAGFFVDGIYVFGNISSYQLDNLERVEVIRGPQAALYGRQTFAGAINFVTRKPDNELRAGFEATVGQYDHYEASGFVSMPLTEDVAALELNARYYDFGGDYKNAATGKRDINDQRSWNIGAKFRFTPSSNFEAIISAAYGEDQDKGYATYRLLADDLNCFLPETDTLAPFFGIPRSTTRSRGYFCGEVEHPEETLIYNIDDIEALGYHGVDRSYFRTDLTMNFTTDSDWTLTSITSFNGSENQNGYDNDLFITDTPSLLIGGTSTHDFSQNFRVLSPQSNRLRGLAGAYYFRQRDGEGFNVDTVYNLSRPTRPNPNFGDAYRFDSDDGINNWALYGMLELDVTDRLTVSAAGRYQEDEILESQEVNGSDNAPTPAINLRSETYTAFLPRFTARYELTPDWNLYSSVAKGNKPGGFNSYPSDASPEGLQSLIDRNIETFDEETVWSYELGTKGNIPGTRLSFNLAGYYLDWTSQQLTQSQPYARSETVFSTTPFIINAGASEIKGLELELFGSLTDWFDIRVGYSYNNAKFTDFYDENTEELLDTDGEPSFLDQAFTQPNPNDVDGPNGQVKGKRLPQTPAHQINLSGTLRFPVGNGSTLFLRNDMLYEGNRYAQVHNLARTGDSYNWNVRAGIELGNVKVTAWVDNLLEDQTPATITRLLDFSRTLFVPDLVRSDFGLPNSRFTFYRGFVMAAPRKRQFGLTVNWKY